MTRVVAESALNKNLTAPLEVVGESLTDQQKIAAIEFHFSRIMETLGLDLSDDSLKDTPARVAKMYVSEIFSGLREEAFPPISVFENSYH